MNNLYFKVTEVEAYTLDEIVQFGLLHSANIVEDMPWSFDFLGFPVSHETDNLYIVGNGLHISHKEVLTIHKDKHLEIIPMTRFAREYMEDM